MATKTSKQPMESLSGKVPIALYQRFMKYCDCEKLSKSEALRDLLSRALYETAITEQITQLLIQQHGITREETRQLTALLVGNISAKEPVPRQAIPELIEQTVAHAHSLVAKDV